MKKIFTLILMVFLVQLVAPALAGERAGSRKASGDSTRAPLEVVFCLDLSGSTNGVLNDLRERYWTLVNHTRQAQPGRELRIGLVGFSRPSFGKENGYVRVLAPISSDLDKAMLELMRLKPYVEKGDQYVSTALKACIQTLAWTDDPLADRMVFLIGNGMVSADGYDFTRYSDIARNRGIRVHSLYARRQHGFFKEYPGWKRIAGISGGQAMEFRVNEPDSVLTWPTCTEDRMLSLETEYPVADQNLEVLLRGNSQESRTQRLFYRATNATTVVPAKNNLIAAESDEAVLSAPADQAVSGSESALYILTAEQIQASNTALRADGAGENHVLYRCILSVLFTDLGLLQVNP
ncbi:MAG: vWA domain-containing protein [Bacteroidota bacterium]